MFVKHTEKGEFSSSLPTLLELSPENFESVILDHGIRRVDAKERKHEPKPVGQADKKSDFSESLVAMSAVEEKGEEVNARSVKLDVELD